MLDDREALRVPTPAIARFKLWHLVLLVGFVAVAIADIQDHRRTEPALIALAAGGFTLYAILAWLGWGFARRFEGRVGKVGLIALYLGSMAALFLLATVVYLMIEHVYLGGRF